MPVERLHVLLIEDNPGDVRLIEEQLRQVAGFDCLLDRADRLSAGLERLQRGGVDVVVLDLTLPDSFGYETFLRLHAHAPRLPVVLLTGLDDEELGARAVRDGAQDYLVKGNLDCYTLARALRYAVERKRSADALRQSELLFEKMFSNLLDAVFVIEVCSKKIVNCNPAVSAIFGFTPGELIGLSSAILFSANGWDSPELLGRPGENGKQPHFQYETMAVRKDGSEFNAEISYVHLNDDISQVDNWVVIVRDISERKIAEETLRESQERYELAVRGANDGRF